ncbi:dihydrolipoyllysine-residue succinyltransferase, partial [bacterium]|nr:dihydrolipoyllysine-residue succinyltransferase [bacterium]
AAPAQDGPVMPAAARAMAERGVSRDQVTGSGPGGRVLKEDVPQQAPAGTPARAGTKSAPAPTPPAFTGERNVRRERMTPIRRKIAERLVHSQQTAALLTTFNEVDMSRVKALRAENQEAFTARYGVKLGFMSFFVKAAVEALRLVPQLNAQIDGDDMIHHEYCDIGIAVGGGKGLVVPVIRNAENLDFGAIEQVIADFGQRAQANRIDLDELQGGTFTISNGGVYGSLLSTPIINPPQSGVLGLHGIQDRPVVSDGQIVIRPMMYIAMTYDHRLVDGREAVTFLKHIKECVERPERMLLKV